jgi:hypothetical protein
MSADVSHDTFSENPEPRNTAATPEFENVTWGQVVTVLENAAEHKRRWQSILLDEIANSNSLTDRERDTLRRGVRQHGHEAAAYETALRLFNRARGDRHILGRLREIVEAELSDDLR